MAELTAGLQQNWYLAIPWALASGGWWVTRQRKVARPWVPSAVLFLCGCVVVLVIDLAQP
jgi:hypothetical protein